MKKLILIVTIFLLTFNACSENIINYEPDKTHSITYEIYNVDGVGILDGYYINPETKEYQDFQWNYTEPLKLKFENVHNIKLELIVKQRYGNHFKVSAKIYKDDYNLLVSKSDYGEVYVEYKLH